jgi:arylsulfatase
VLIIMTDDVGFGASSTFGGPVPTPTMEDLAREGVRYNEFHNASVCSPSRAALLTGRNPHSVGFGVVAEMATGYPGYNSVIPPSAATIGRVLRDHGYSTSWFGKNHNTPVWERSPVGPFVRSPAGFGFEYFFGFHGAETNQFAPELYLNFMAIEPPTDDDTYTLDRDMADHAIDWLRMQAAQEPAGKPFLMYYVPGTTHAPLHAPKEWIEKYRGQFDDGWDALREKTFERQKALGIIPADAKLTPMSPGTPAWASLSPEQKRMAARFMEVYVAALSHCDHQIGRVIEELKRSGRFENTLIFYIMGDNGSSAEGGADGAFNYKTRINGVKEDLATNLARIDELGGPKSYPVGPVGWARAMNAPFQWNKTVASHFGGTRMGVVVSWPGHLSNPEKVRSQFLHLIDIAPTLYEAIGIQPPAEVDGVLQKPLEGVSLFSTFSRPDAPTGRRVQYFEMQGNMGLYDEDWFLSSTPTVSGESLYNASRSSVAWELYDLHNDYSQANNLAAQNPDRVAKMAARFTEEADRHQVNPITSAMAERIADGGRPVVLARPGRFTLYADGQRYQDYAFPDIKNRSWVLEADIEAPPQGGDGAIISQGDIFAGWGLFVIKRTPTFIYRLTDTPSGLLRLAAPGPLSPGPHRIGVRFKYDGGGMGKGGDFTLLVDGQAVAHARLERTVGLVWGGRGGAVGWAAANPLSDDYQTPFKYSGALKQVVIDTEARDTELAERMADYILD